MRPIAKVAGASVVAGGAIIAALALHAPSPKSMRATNAQPTTPCSHAVFVDDGSGPRQLTGGDVPMGCPPRFQVDGKNYRLVDEDAAARKLVYRAVGIPPNPS